LYGDYEQPIAQQIRRWVDNYQNENLSEGLDRLDEAELQRRPPG
jgi:hypothetical protein